MGADAMDDASLAVFLNLTDEEAEIIIPSLTLDRRAVYERMAAVEIDLNMGVFPPGVIICREIKGKSHADR